MPPDEIIPGSQVVDLATGATDILVRLLLRPENVYLMAAVWSLLGILRRVLPQRVGDHSLYVRLAPVYPLALCSVFVWVPGAQPADVGPASKILIGCILGGACGYLHKVWNQTVRGRDARIKGERRRSTDKLEAGP